MGSLKTWRVPVNTHRFQDLSDPSRLRFFRFRASDRDLLDTDLYSWRDRNEQSGLHTKGGTRFWVGLIHFAAIEQR